jgi:hypothetical protein
MARYRVVQEASGWKVTKNGRRYYQKTYDTKQAALAAARRAANRGDSVQGQTRDGTWGEESTKGIFGPRGDKG